ncbi:hypothetical protein VTI74DRAFT_2490 [Chaetomium olivicolor]
MLEELQVSMSSPDARPVCLAAPWSIASGGCRLESRLQCHQQGHFTVPYPCWCMPRETGAPKPMTLRPVLPLELDSEIVAASVDTLAHTRRLAHPSVPRLHCEKRDERRQKFLSPLIKSNTLPFLARDPRPWQSPTSRFVLGRRPAPLFNPDFPCSSALVCDRRGRVSAAVFESRVPKLSVRSDRESNLSLLLPRDLDLPRAPFLTTKILQRPFVAPWWESAA